MSRSDLSDLQTDRIMVLVLLAVWLLVWLGTKYVIGLSHRHAMKVHQARQRARLHERHQRTHRVEVRGVRPRPVVRSSETESSEPKCLWPHLR